jgi:hypothetical protein
MEQQPKPVDALQALYAIARQAPLSADGHDQARKLAEIVIEVLEKEQKPEQAPEVSKETKEK